MGAGRAIVSTPYAYASELLADGRGVLVPPASPVALAAALNALLGDPALRATIGSRAYAHSRGWSGRPSANAYRDLFAHRRPHRNGRDAAPTTPAGGRRCLTAHRSTP